MPRYKLTIEYDGTTFVGWQIQAEGRSVQGELAAAIARFCGEQVVVRGAGRTDSGVHARGQVAHIDLAKDWPAEKVRDAINFHLKPQPIAVLECTPVDDDFDARFSAIARHYRYRILSRRAPVVLVAGRVWWVPVPLDVHAMQDAAQVLVGRHDFTTFRATGCQAKSPVKTLDRLDVSQNGDEIWIEASARSFLHHQVRSLAGALKVVGSGKWTRADLAEVLAACDRTRCAPVAPAAGLYFMQVDYS
ncbi:MAG: tRNA pseudouridine(38-40) synthase TruA [Hyphomicrobiaceae bacterium]